MLTGASGVVGARLRTSMMPNPTPSPRDTQPRCSTGIGGLDAVLNGGLPAEHLYLVEGEPGAGKTTLGLQFLMAGARLGERVMYVTLSETAEELDIVAGSHGWTLDGINVFELSRHDGFDLSTEQSVLHPSDLELGETTDDILRRVVEQRPERLVFDSLSEMRLLAQDPLRYRRQILAMKHFFAQHRCTVLMLDDRSSKAGDLQVHSIAHGVLSLSQDLGHYGEAKRTVRVVKLRGSTFRGGEHDLSLQTGGIAIYPRLVASEHRRDITPEMRSSGNAAFDAMSGGGLCYGTSLLFLGPSGLGKTTTAMSCVAAALRRGERASYYMFDEGVVTLMARCEALGMDVRSAVDSGQLELVRLDPSSISPGEFVARVRDAVEHKGSRVLVIDSLNAYLHAMPGGKALILQMHELLQYLGQHGVATILVLSQHGIFGEDQNDIDLSYLSDSILQFRYFEARGKLLKALSFVKSRTAQHESTIREFRLDAHGVSIGEALSDFEGVMRGVPSYRGPTALLGDVPARAG